MSENNKSYRIRTNIGSEYNGNINLDVNLLQSYDMFEILSLKINTENLYKYHTSKYGCIVGRVLANGGVGVPNVKISAFIPLDGVDSSDSVFSYLYPYTSTRDKNRNNIRYNLLTDQKINDCHQNIGTFPNKRLVLDDNNVIEVFDKYYKYTTTTNGSGDYMLFGIPVGNNILHSDLDLSDIGILSQKPRDLFYKGYTARQFENASQFKKDTNIDNLTQVISQDSSVYVFPFWGDEIENEGQIKIVRNDIDVNYKFEPTCIFIGSIVSDEKSNAISKNCIPHERMGKMDRLTTGTGTIEMIRKTMSGNVESIAIQGNELIDGNGTWCYQIPMNLDYMATDEYGNLVPTDNYEKGIPTRTSVRFRVSLADYESDSENAHLVKVLVPNNPSEETNNGNLTINYDYEFGSLTKDETFRNMFWNNVYTVKQYVPRFQKGNRQRNKNFTGFKAVNVNGANNPIPYNNMRINLTFLFVFQCLIFKSMIMIVKILNKLITVLNRLSSVSSNKTLDLKDGSGLAYITVDGGMCPTLDGNYIAPGANSVNKKGIIEHTYNNVFGESFDIAASAGDDSGEESTDAGTVKIADSNSADGKNDSSSNFKTYVSEDSDASEPVKIYNTEDYFVKCVELQFAMEYEVIQFDFYNDWINGMLYIPRWFAEVKKNKEKMYYCGETFSKNRNLVQQCALGYDKDGIVISNFGCDNKKQQCHKRKGRKVIKAFGNNKGIVERRKTSKGQSVYYLRPCEINKNGDNGDVRANLFSTDIVLLGSVLDCNQYGIPKVSGYVSSSYIMPSPTAEIVSDTQEMELSTSNSDKATNYTIVIKSLNKEVNGWINKANTKTYYNSETSTCCSEIDTHSGGYWVEKGGYHTEILKVDFPTTSTTYDFNELKTLVNKKIEEFYRKRDCWIRAVGKSEEAGAIDSDDRDDGHYITYFRLIAWSAIDEYKTLFYNLIDGTTETNKFYTFTKKITSSVDDETVTSEISGIDWGYNPFTKVGDDDTTKLEQQIGGHFLEIGCTFSLSNVKSCVNLQRICEIGSEMSQSHYYYNYEEKGWRMLSPTGIIAKREISDAGIRTTFATLNSNNLTVIVDSNTNYKKYRFMPYSPSSFMGELQNIIQKNAKNLTSIDENDGKNSYGLIENSSLSYKRFRFGVSGDTITNKFLYKENEAYYMPQYANSFYFYFGLKDGNTAIDRLYTEYYAECPKTNDGDKVEPTLELTSKLFDIGNNKSQIIYTVENFGKVKTVKLYKFNGTEYVETEYDSIDGNTITITGSGKYRVVLRNSEGLRLTGTVTVEGVKPTVTFLAKNSKELGKVIIYYKLFNFGEVKSITVTQNGTDITTSKCTIDKDEKSITISYTEKTVLTYTITFVSTSGKKVSKDYK